MAANQTESSRLKRRFVLKVLLAARFKSCERICNVYREKKSSGRSTLVYFGCCLQLLYKTTHIVGFAKSLPNNFQLINFFNGISTCLRLF